MLGYKVLFLAYVARLSPNLMPLTSLGGKVLPPSGIRLGDREVMGNVPCSALRRKVEHKKWNIYFQIHSEKIGKAVSLGLQFFHDANQSSYQIFSSPSLLGTHIVIRPDAVTHACR